MLDIRPEERGPVALLLLHAACMGVGNVFLDAPASALFLTYYSVATLPYVYLASAGSTVLFGIAYARLEQRVRPVILLAGTLASLGVMLLLLYVGMLGFAARWLAIVAMMWKDVQFILSGMVLWAVAGMMFNLRQGKRLFGIIGVGEVVAVTAGGLTVPLVVRVAGTVHLLVVAIIAQVLSLILLGVAATRFRDRMAVTPTETAHTPRAARRRSLGTLLRDRYIVLLFSVSIISYLAYYLIDYSFYGRVQTLYGTPDRVASFYGLFVAAAGAVNLLSNIFLSGPLLTRFGVGLGLLVLPFIDGVGGLSSAVAASALGLFAWLLIATKLGDEVLRKSIEGPVYRILYQPLRRPERLRVQALRESVVEPLALGLSGFVLIVLTSWLHVGPAGLVRLLCVVTACWIVVAFFLSRGYAEVLGAAIGRRRVGGADGVLSDGRSKARIENFLASGSSAEVLWALRVIEESDVGTLDARCIALLGHRDATIRRHVLSVLERRVPADGREAVRAQLARERDPETRGVAVRTICAFLEADAIDEVVPFVTGGDRTERHGALVGLLRYGGIDGVLGAGPRLQSMVQSDDAMLRNAAAEVIGDAGVVAFYRSLRPLLTDPDLKVRRTALVAAGRLGSPRLASAVVDQLFVPHVADAAASSLQLMAAAALPAIAARFGDIRLSSGNRARLAHLLGSIGGGDAQRVLAAHAQHPDPSLRTHVLAALVASGWHATPSGRAALTEALRAEAADVAHACAVLVDLGEGADPTLRSALQHEATEGRGRVLTIITLLHPAEAMRDAVRGLDSTSTEQRAQALEILESTIARPLRTIVVPILDDLSPAERVRRLAPAFPNVPRPAAARLRELLDDSVQRSSWFRAVVLHVAACDPTIDMRGALTRAAADPERIVRETGAWIARGRPARALRAHPAAVS